MFCKVYADVFYRDSLSYNDPTGDRNNIGHQRDYGVPGLQQRKGFVYQMCELLMAAEFLVRQVLPLSGHPPELLLGLKRGVFLLIV